LAHPVDFYNLAFCAAVVGPLPHFSIRQKSSKPDFLLFTAENNVLPLIIELFARH